MCNSYIFKVFSILENLKHATDETETVQKKKRMDEMETNETGKRMKQYIKLVRKNL